MRFEDHAVGVRVDRRPRNIGWVELVDLAVDVERVVVQRRDDRVAVVLAGAIFNAHHFHLPMARHFIPVVIMSPAINDQT